MDTERAQVHCLIVGAGAAGFSAALWLEEFKVPYRWISMGGELGGILGRVNNPIKTIPGMPLERGKDAPRAWRAQLDALGLQGPEDDELAHLSVEEDLVLATLKRAGQLRAQRVLLATGTRYRQLHIPGEQDGLVQGVVSQSVSGDAASVAGQRVAIVGGGDAAFEGALILAKHGCQVELMLRSWPPQARAQFVAPVQQHPNITLWPVPAQVTQVHADAQEHTCTLSVKVGELAPVQLKVAKLFVRVGVEPVCPPGASLLRDEAGYLRVDHQGRTNIPQLFAAGDVISDPLQAVSWAIGQGARCARAIAHDLGRFAP